MRLNCIKRLPKVRGININVVQEPADGYWSNVWLKKGWCACYWSGRATEDWMFSTAYESGVPWNDTHWENARFQELVVDVPVLNWIATSVVNNTQKCSHFALKRVERIVPMFANYCGCGLYKLAHGPDIGNIWQMDSSRLTERWWFA